MDFVSPLPGELEDIKRDNINRFIWLRTGYSGGLFCIWVEQKTGKF
jgi:hypothetical protein